MVRSLEKQVRWFWRFVMMPVLFGLVGASVNFATIQRGIIPKACAIIVAGKSYLLHVLAAPWLPHRICCPPKLLMADALVTLFPGEAAVVSLLVFTSHLTFAWCALFRCQD